MAERLRALDSSDAELASASEIRPEDVALALAWLRLYAPELARMAEAAPYERERLTVAVIAGLAASGRYAYLTQRAAYYDLRRRQVVLPATVRQRLDRALDRAGRDARAQTLALRERRVDLQAWEIEMRQHVKAGTVAAVILALGGARRLHVEAVAATQERIRGQLVFLRRFAQQIEAGEQPLDGRAMLRAEAYLQAARGAHMEFREQAAASVGYDQKLNIRYPGDSCDGCVAMAELGWIPIQDPRWIPIGSRECLYNCRCDEVFRNSATGERSDGGQFEIGAA